MGGVLDQAAAAGARYAVADEKEGEQDDGGGGEAGIDAGGAVVAGDEAQIPADWLVLGRKLGKGAFGDVLEGEVSMKIGMRSRKEKVACKAIQDTTKEADLMRECRFHMRLNHANIVEVRATKFVVGEGGVLCVWCVAKCKRAAGSSAVHVPLFPVCPSFFAPPVPRQSSSRPRPPPRTITPYPI